MGLTLNIEKQLEHFTLKVALTCPAGELLALVGPSGAGKTTLLRIIAGLEHPDKGVVQFGSSVWTSTKPGNTLPPRKRKLAMVFQNSLLFPHMTLKQNAIFAAEDEACVPELLDRFRIGHLADAKPSEVSGGERQRAAFCQALARGPELLLLDEPFSALDPETRVLLRRELKRIKEEQGLTVVHVTHDLSEADYLADSVTALERGRIAPSWTEKQRLAERQARRPVIRIAA